MDAISLSDLIARTAADAAGSVRHWLGVAQQLRDAGQTDRALGLLQAADGRFPGDPGVLHDLARMAEARRDWLDAERLWRAFVERAPHIWWAPVQLAAALREQQRVSEADAIFAAALDRFPDEPAVFIEYARQAARHADRPEAARRWASAVARFPANWEACQGHARALREQGSAAEARSVLTEATIRCPGKAAVFHDLAWLEEAERNWSAAEAAWRKAIMQDPDPPWFCHTGLASALRHQGRTAEAEAELLAGLACQGAPPEIGIEYARLAELQADWQQAFTRFRRCLERFPDHPIALIGAASALAHQGQMAGANAFLDGAIERLPANVALRIARTRLPIAAGSSGDAEWLVRSGLLHSAMPADLLVCRNFVEALQSNHQYAELETLLTSATRRFPADEGMLHALATTLARREKWQPAFDVFAAAVARHPANAQLLADYARALIAAKRWDAAKLVIGDATRLFPAETSFGTALLDILIAQGDVAGATAEWRALDARSAGSERLRHDLFERRNLLLGLGIDPADDSIAAPAVHAGDEVQTIVGCFESLGGYGLGCEFGLFQRHFGIEPIGLLRWSEIVPDQLVDALQSGFEGVGSPEQTVLSTPKQGNHLEYTASDRRFGMGMHTFVRADQVPFDQMLVQIRRRLTFLRDKLLTDLRNGEKIFVYKNAYRNLTDDEIGQLHRAIRRYGDTTLFCLRRADETRPFPLVEMPRPGLLIGYIDGFSFDPNGADRSLPVASWSALAVSAYRMHMNH